jgi:CRP/FNR family cyclic AMP-dependent transcriptional regulator
LSIAKYRLRRWECYNCRAIGQLSIDVSQEKMPMPADPRLLRTIPLFIGMDDDERAAIAAIMDEQQYKAGAVIFGAEQTGGTLYIVQSGQVELSIIDDDEEKLVLELLESGDFFGELSLLDGGSRSATAMATQLTDTLVLERHEFLDLMLQKPHMAQDVMVALAKRIRRTDNLLRRRVSRNVNEIADEKLTVGQRIADVIAEFSGSIPFLVLNAVFFTVWIIVNVIPPITFDPFPFGLLTMIVSLEAIFLSIFVLVSQNRQSDKDRIRNELDYQVNLKAELGVSVLLHKADALTESLQEIEKRLAAVSRRQ